MHPRPFLTSRFFQRRALVNAMQKVAWTNLIVSAAAIAAATLLYPFLGSQAATGAFGLLGFLALSGLFLRRRGDRVVVDERDREIDIKAKIIGVGTAWMTLSMTLAVATVWSSYWNIHAVSTGFLNWLIWINFAICYGMYGLAAVVLYRRQQHAA